MPISAPDIRDEFGLAYGGTSMVVLVLPLLLAMLIEGPLLLVSDRWRRERVVPISLALMGLFMLAAAAAGSMWLLGLAFAGWACVGGLGLAQAQGVLMDAFPEQRERWMTRWTLFGSLGDLAAPLLVFALALLGLGWRGGLAAVGVLHLAHALVLALVGLPKVEASDDEDDDEDGSLWQRLLAGLRDRELLAWLIGGALCSLMDEILVMFGALFMRDELGFDTDTQGLVFVAGAVGSVLGLLVTERLLERVDPLRLLIVASVLCAASYVGWLCVGSVPASVVLFGLVGATCAPLYPICSARAFAARPGEAGLVAAVDQAFAWVPVLMPFVLGLLADRWGVLVSLAILLLQPIGVALIAVLRSPRASVVGRATGAEPLAQDPPPER